MAIEFKPQLTSKPVKSKEPPRPTTSKASFNRNAYQAQYMRWKRAADKLGITVSQYRQQERER